MLQNPAFTPLKLCFSYEAEEPATSQDENNQDGEPGDREKRDPDQLFTVLVPLRSFLKFLNSHVVSTTTIACAYFHPMIIIYWADGPVGICQNHCLILYVYIGDFADAGGVLTFYIPAILDDGDH